MKPSVLSLIVLSLVTICLPLVAATTPKPGSPTRTAICDALRLYVRYNQQLTPQQADFKWQIDQMLVQDGFASFEGRPFEAEGKLDQFFIDQDHVYILKKSKQGAWEVIYDFSRTDVPGSEELAHIKKEFPPGVPPEILPPFWREALGK